MNSEYRFMWENCLAVLRAMGLLPVLLPEAYAAAFTCLSFPRVLFVKYIN